MARTKISEFSATPGNNTDIDGINLAEGCAPSGINDAIRELMSQLKDFQAGTAGDSFNGPVGTTTAAAGMFTTLSASGAVTLSGGTANGVAYLNGSKVLTSGSALQFDGTNLGLGVTPSAWGASYKAVELSGGVALTSYSTVGDMQLFANAYSDGGSYRYKTSTYASNYEQYQGKHIWYTAPSGTAGNAITFTQAMTLNAAGNLGLGVTPSAWGNTYRMQQIGVNTAVGGRTTAAQAYIAANWYHDGTNNRYITSAAATQYQQDAGAHYWFTAPSGTAGNAISFTQAMTLDASGNLLVGVTSAIGGAAERFQVRTVLSGGSEYGIAVGGASGSYANYALRTINTATNTVVGSITFNASVTAYNTSSDYRLKENIQPMTGALAKVAALKPCTYKWKADGSDGEGFIAHELAEVVPQCVTGEKDAVDADGNPVYQGIDTSFLVATLTAAIQEQQAIITQLKARLDAANL